MINIFYKLISGGGACSNVNLLTKDTGKCSIQGANNSYLGVLIDKCKLQWIK